MRKAISEVVVAIMLLMIAVSLVGVAYVFIMGFQEQAKSEVQQTGTESFKKMGSCLQIVSFDEKANNLYVKNCGRYPIDNVTVFIDKKPASSVPINAKPNEIKNITISATAGTHEIKIEGDYASIITSINMSSYVPYIIFGAGNEEAIIASSNSEAVGTLATDGKYIYGKSWASYDGNDLTINKIGSGYGGTTAGTDYGALATVTSSLSIFYLNGYVYNGYTSNGQDLQRVDVSSGAVSYQSLGGRILNRGTGTEISGVSNDIIITSDGKFVYNLAYGIGAPYNGWKLRVFDPNSGWNIVRTISFGTISYYTDGLVADGNYIYPIEWTSTNNARIYAFSPASGEKLGEWKINQGDTEIINGQYDWVNKKVWLGGLGNVAGRDKIHRYSAE